VRSGKQQETGYRKQATGDERRREGRCPVSCFLFPVSCLLLLLLSACGATHPPSAVGSVSPGATSAPSGLGAEWITKGEAAYRAGNVDRASGAFERALRLAPDDERAKVGMALVEMARTDFPAAAHRTEGLGGDGAAIHLQAAWLAGDLAKARAAAKALPSVRGLNALIAALAAEESRHPYARGDGAPIGSMPLASDAPLPVVEVRIDGRPARLLVDTGAIETILDRSFAGAGDTKWISELALGSFVLKDVPAFVRDLSPLARSLQTELDGIVGVEVLRRTHATLDYVEGWLVVHADPAAPERGATDVPFHVFRGRYLSMPVAIEGHEPAPFLVASGGTFAVALSDDALRASGRDPASLRREADGLARYAISRLTIGTLTVSEIPAVHGVFPRSASDDAGVDFAGVVSQQLLAGFKVTIDAGRRVLEWSSPPEEGG